MDRKAKYIVVVVLVVAIVVSMLLYSWFWLFYNVQEPPCPPPPPPIFVNGTVEKTDGNYKITITEIRNSEYDLELSNIKVVLLNSSGYVSFRHLLGELLNNESSEIIFYDNDGNSTLSAGDVFILRGYFVEHGDEFGLVSIVPAKCIYETQI